MRSLVKKIGETLGATPEEVSQPAAFVAAFGKHRSLPDHLPLIGPQSLQLLAFKQATYDQGFNSQMVTWRKLEAAGQAIPWGHLFTVYSNNELIVSRLWRSSDSVDRKDFPMVLCAYVRGCARWQAVQLCSPVLLASEAEIKSAATRDELKSVVDKTQLSLSKSVAENCRDDDADAKSADLALAGFFRAAPRDEAARILLAVDACADGLKQARSGDVTTSRASAHFRLPQIGSVQDTMRGWTNFFLRFVEDQCTVRMIVPDGREWIDVLLGEPTETRYYCFRASDAILPLTSRGSEPLSPEQNARAQILVEMLFADLPALDPPVATTPPSLPVEPPTPPDKEPGAVPPPASADPAPPADSTPVVSSKSLDQTEDAQLQSKIEPSIAPIPAISSPPVVQPPVAPQKQRSNLPRIVGLLFLIVAGAAVASAYFFKSPVKSAFVADPDANWSVSIDGMVAQAQTSLQSIDAQVTRAPADLRQPAESRIDQAVTALKTAEQMVAAVPPWAKDATDISGFDPNAILHGRERARLAVDQASKQVASLPQTLWNDLRAWTDSVSISQPEIARAWKRLSITLLPETSGTTSTGVEDADMRDWPQTANKIERVRTSFESLSAAAMNAPNDFAPAPGPGAGEWEKQLHSACRSDLAENESRDLEKILDSWGQSGPSADDIDRFNASQAAVITRFADAFRIAVRVQAMMNDGSSYPEIQNAWSGILPSQSGSERLKQALDPLSRQVDQLANIPTASNEELRRDFTAAAPSIALASQGRLWSIPPESLDDLEPEAQATANLRSELAQIDSDRAKASLDRLQSAAKARWAQYLPLAFGQAAGNPPAVAAIDRVLKSTADFGVPLNDQGLPVDALPEPLPFNLLMYQLNNSVQAYNDHPDSANFAAVVSALGRMDACYSTPSTAAGDPKKQAIASLKLAIYASTQPAPSTADPASSLGPATTAQWKAIPNGSADLVFAAEGEQLEFKLVSGANVKPYYLCTTVLSVGALIVASHDAKVHDGLKRVWNALTTSKNPLVPWIIRRDKIAVAQPWYPESEQIRPTPIRFTPSSPATFLPPSVCGEIVRALHCRIPTAEEWVASIHQCGDELKDPAYNGYWAALDWTDYWDSISNPDKLAQMASLSGLKVEDLNMVKIVAGDPGIWLRDVPRPDGHFHDLTGNAAQWVVQGDAWLLAGRSMVASSLVPDDVPVDPRDSRFAGTAWPNPERTGYPDVGLRPAFDVPIPTQNVDLPPAKLPFGQYF